jgi:hypothetical protein
MAGLVTAPAILFSAFAVHLLEGPGDHQMDSERFSQELISASLQLLYTFVG